MRGGKRMKDNSYLITHGDCVTGKITRLYRAWQNMKWRCLNPNTINYHRYGGRGIIVCKEWKNSYLNFKKWAVSNGYKDGLSIDRIDNDKGYSPINCQWITRVENTIKGSATRRKLSFADAENIRTSNLTQRKLAKKYNVTKTAIASIKHYRTYKKDYENEL